MKNYEQWFDRIMLEQRSLESRQEHIIEMLQWIMGYLSGIDFPANLEQFEERNQEQQQPRQRQRR